MVNKKQINSFNIVIKFINNFFFYNCFIFGVFNNRNALPPIDSIYLMNLNNHFYVELAPIFT